MRLLLLLFAGVVSLALTTYVTGLLVRELRRPKPTPGLVTPPPPYPYEARAHHVEGNGTFLVHFDAAGQPTSVETVESTGSKLLDDNTVAWAKLHWHGPASRAIRVPLTYTLGRHETPAGSPRRWLSFSSANSFATPTNSPAGP